MTKEQNVKMYNEVTKQAFVILILSVTMDLVCVSGSIDVMGRELVCRSRVLGQCSLLHSLGATSLGTRQL